MQNFGIAFGETLLEYRSFAIPGQSIYYYIILCLLICGRRVIGLRDIDLNFLAEKPDRRYRPFRIAPGCEGQLNSMFSRRKFQRQMIGLSAPVIVHRDEHAIIFVSMLKSEESIRRILMAVPLTID